MTTTNEYIKAAIDHLPRGGPIRARIEMEIRVIVAEQLERGRTPEEVFRELGDPKSLAESYLSAVPLVAAPLSRRIGAKLADIAMVVIVIVAGLVMAGWALAPETAALVVVAGLIGGGVGYGTATIGMEYWSGQTIGKRLFGLQVVRESGAAISFGQSIVRQVPILLQMYWIDVLFAFFTEKQQRAFELLSKTRVVMLVPISDDSSRQAGRTDHA